MRVTGYVDGYRDISTVRWDLLTEAMVLYAIVGPDGSVTVRPSNHFAECVSKGHAAGCKVLLTLGAQTRQDWNQGISTPLLRDRVATRTLAIMRQFGFDGIDLDLETPYADSYDNWKALVVDLHSYLAPGELLTDAITAGVEAYGTNPDGTFKYRVAPDGTLIGDDVLALFDLLNVMTYDGHYVYTKNPALNAPYEYFVASLDYWLGRGIPPSKLAMGIPFYGVKAADGVTKNFVDLVADGANPDANTFNFWWYDGRPLAVKKTNYAQSKQAGMMLFHMAGDDPQHSLAVAITDTTEEPPVSTDRQLADQANQAIRKTTITYPQWNKNVQAGKYPASGPPSQFGIAFGLLAQIGTTPPPQFGAKLYEGYEWSQQEISGTTKTVTTKTELIAAIASAADIIAGSGLIDLGGTELKLPAHTSFREIRGLTIRNGRILKPVKSKWRLQNITSQFGSPEDDVKGDNDGAYLHLRNCDIGHAPRQGMLLYHSDVVAENTRFHHNGSQIDGNLDHGTYGAHGKRMLQIRCTNDQNYAYAIQLYPAWQQARLVQCTYYSGTSRGGAVFGSENPVGGNNPDSTADLRWIGCISANSPTYGWTQYLEALRCTIEHCVGWNNRQGDYTLGFQPVGFVHGDPKFVDAANADFRIGPGSAALNIIPKALWPYVTSPHAGSGVAA